MFCLIGTLFPNILVCIYIKSGIRIRRFYKKTIIEKKSPFYFCPSSRDIFPVVMIVVSVRNEGFFSWIEAESENN